MKEDSASDPVYLDHNATTPILAEVLDAMLPFLREHFGNPSSGHVYGRRAKEGVSLARSQIAALLDCDADEVVLTSGGTEANNLAISSAHAALPARGKVVTSCIEHPATVRPCGRLAEQGFLVERLSVDSEGRVRIEDAERAIDQATALVTVMHSNNETGVLQPIARLAALARERGAFMHSDAAQSVGKVPVSVRNLDLDYLSLAGHKLYAPKGVGALFVRRGAPLLPCLLGAGHEEGRRPGTENVASIVGLGAACQRAMRDLNDESERQRQLRDELFSRLKAQIPGIALHGAGAERLPNTLSVRFPEVLGSEVLRLAPRIAASTGSACHDGEEAASPVISALGIDERAALGTVRLTLGRRTQASDVALAAEELVSAHRHAMRLASCR